MARRQVVMTFDERADLGTSRLRGGKGANLSFMRQLGLPVPAGFTISTTVARAVMQNDRLPNRVEGQLERALAAVEKETGRRLGDAANPLLLSVRSGAEFSMPGMMDTILNLGLNGDIVRGLASATNPAFAADCYARFRIMYQDTVGTLAVPSDPREQLQGAINAVIASWKSDRAIAYRLASGIPEHLGTAVNVQAMVFGNRCERSGTGVVFSRDPNTGTPGLYGEFLPQAQGEDIVAGTHTPLPIEAMATWNPAVYNQLEQYVLQLEGELRAIVEVEFTVEQGRLWILQCRAAKLSGEAAATYAVHRVWSRQWEKEQALASLTPDQVTVLDQRPAFAPDTGATTHSVVAQGQGASPGAAVGTVAHSCHEALAMHKRGLPVVLVCNQTNVHDLPAMLVAKAIVTQIGGTTSHAAVVARMLGIPAVVGVGDLPDHSPLRSHAEVSVCGTIGVVYAGHVPVVAPTHKKEVNIFLKWVRGNMPAARIDFSAVKKRLNVNSVLADVYLLESMAFASKASPIGREVANLLNRVRIETAETFACYLCIAVASEIRYVHSRERVWNALSTAERNQLAVTYGINRPDMRGDDQILGRLEPRGLDGQIAFFRFAEMVNSKAQWGHDTYTGGLKWAYIAQAGSSFLSGELTHGVFVDRLFNLSHNTGPIFDKHHMVGEGFNSQLQTHLLDLKRSALNASELFAAFKDASVSRTYDTFRYMGEKPWQRFSPSREVLVLWEKGVKLNLWKEGK